jgi:glycosyltransferase involved in cell wall biosynthesis
MKHDRPRTLWVDLDDLVQYLARNSRPSGIQRVTFEICQALQRLDGGAGRVRFLRRNSGPCDLVTVEWSAIESSFLHMADSETRPDHAARVTVSPVPGGEEWLPGGSRLDVARAGLRAQWQVLAVLLSLLQAAVWRGAAAMRRRISKQRRQAAPEPTPQDLLRTTPGTALNTLAASGDVFIVLGAPWSQQDYVQTVRWLRGALHLRFAVLIHDMIPLRRPEWCDRSVIITFANWHRTVLPYADMVFSNSQATANDVTACAKQAGIALSRPVVPIPMGTGLHHWQNPPSAGAEPTSDAMRHVLFVSTIEARKNHALLFRVWQRLLADLPHGQVPVLVFAGRVGWLVDDLMQQLDNARWLGGKIRLVRNPSDAELAALYDSCLFTVFPSFYEGWGLPITESLARGCPCLCSGRTSLPEAGGRLARYFDPDNVDDAYRAIRYAIEDKAGLAEWRERIRREFEPVSWDSSAAAMARALGFVPAQVGGRR